MIANLPEPSTIILVGLALLALVVVGWVKARRPAKRRADEKKP